MKNLLVGLLLLFFSFSTYGQDLSGLKVGGHFGLPMGSTKGNSYMTYKIDAAYLWNLAENFDAGIGVGYMNYPKKTVKRKKTATLTYLPINLTAQYETTPDTFLGLDLGYAIGLAPKINNGGLYFLPKFGYKNDFMEIFGGAPVIMGRFDSMGGTYTPKVNIYALVIGAYYKFN